MPCSILFIWAPCLANVCVTATGCRTCPGWQESMSHNDVLASWAWPAQSPYATHISPASATQQLGSYIKHYSLFNHISLSAQHCPFSKANWLHGTNYSNELAIWRVSSCMHINTHIWYIYISIYICIYIIYDHNNRYIMCILYTVFMCIYPRALVLQERCEHRVQRHSASTLRVWPWLRKLRSYPALRLCRICVNKHQKLPWTHGLSGKSS